jgi:hypothetical protein
MLKLVLVVGCRLAKAEKREREGGRERGGEGQSPRSHDDSKKREEQIGGGGEAKRAKKGG